MGGKMKILRKWDFKEVIKKQIELKEAIKKMGFDKVHIHTSISDIPKERMPKSSRILLRGDGKKTKGKTFVIEKNPASLIYIYSE
jgi:uncharacterized Fe-S cluster-containing radical SAM superfamily protein